MNKFLLLLFRSRLCINFSIKKKECISVFKRENYLGKTEVFIVFYLKYLFCIKNFWVRLDAFCVNLNKKKKRLFHQAAFFVVVVVCFAFFLHSSRIGCIHREETGRDLSITKNVVSFYKREIKKRYECSEQWSFYMYKES